MKLVKLNLKKKIVTCVCDLPLYMPVHHVCAWGPWRPEVGIRFRWTGVTDGYELGIEPRSSEEQPSMNFSSHLNSLIFLHSAILQRNLLGSLSVSGLQMCADFFYFFEPLFIKSSKFYYLKCIFRVGEELSDGSLT